MGTTYDRPYVKNVHDIVTYISYFSYRIDKIKYCPHCNMPEFDNNSFNGTVYCKTCHSYVKKHSLLELDPMNYLTILQNLPLRNGGYSYETNKIKFLEYRDATSPKRCYNDLEQDELLRLDSCSV